MGNLICNDPKQVESSAPRFALEIQKLRVYKQFPLLIYYQSLPEAQQEKFKQSILAANMDPLDYVC
jgi:hypothetical protein